MTWDLLLSTVGGTTAVALLGAVAAAMAGRAPAVLRHLIWRLTVTAFVAVPVAFALTSAFRIRSVQVTVPMPTLRAPAPAPALPPARPQPPEASAAAPSTAPLVATPPTRTPLPSPLAIATWVWLAGAAVSLIGLLRQWRAISRLRQSARPPADADRCRHAEACREMGLRAAPTLATSALVAVPTVLGWRRPLILLPEDTDQDAAGVDACVLHELAHVARADVPWLMASRVIRLAWWWHPLYWLAARELRETAEQACDDWAVTLSGQRKDYATALIGYAERAVGVAGLGCGARGKALTARVKRLLSGRTTSARLTGRAQGLAVGLGIVAVIAAGCLRLGIGAAPAGAAEGTYPSPAQSTLLPPEAIRALDLRLYVTTARPLGPEYSMQVTALTHFVDGEFRRYMRNTEFGFDLANIKRARWLPSAQVLGKQNELMVGPSLQIELTDPELLTTYRRNTIALEDMFERDRARWSRKRPPLPPLRPLHLALTSGMRILTMGNVHTELPGLTIPFIDLPDDTQARLRPYLKGLPCSEGLATREDDGHYIITDPASLIPSVTIKAHFPDGTPAELAGVRFEPWSGEGAAPWPILAPTMTLSNRECKIINITPGRWRYVISGDFATTKDTAAEIEISPRDELTFDIEVHKGAG